MKRATLILALSSLVTTGCNQDPYSVLRLDGQFPDFGIGDTGPGCQLTNGGIEICDRLDNDCNGQIDEDFYLDSDPENCGECGNSCLREGAVTGCELGICKYLGCAPGFVDLNQDTKDGCEYECTSTGEEICDGKDNDCNGQIDETFDLKTDVDNCGNCGSVCRLANAVSRCDEGKCLVLQCKGGFINKDEQNDNGCEEPCVVSNGGVEICDDEDNDCNGVTDDPGGVPIDFDTDSLNCGGCGVKCARANAEAHCVAGGCVLDSCKGSHVDADKDPLNGCECLATGSEVCDGVDNDCNGQIDEGLPALGPCGTDVGECVQGTLVCDKGVTSCINAIGPKPETCDGRDNDCNGMVDNGLPRSLGRCGTDVGECQLGSLVCKSGKPTCEVDEEGRPKPEICDGRDNDCNGKVDDGLGDLGACGSDVGECVAGRRECQGGILTCVGETKPVREICDKKDNDCNGVVDDNLPPSLGTCGSAVGECQLGTLICESDPSNPSVPTRCINAVGPKAEVCDGRDNDCNGKIDDGLGDLGACGSDVGECVAGRRECQGGILTCVGETKPAREICDKKDNDCNGVVDDKLPPSLGTCGSAVGECRLGTLICESDPGNPSVPTRCVNAVGPKAEICDGKDNDCDGVADNGLDGVLGSCGSDEGECQLGDLRCQSGVLVCIDEKKPVPETCDGLDNDCNGVADDGLAPTPCGSDEGDCQRGAWRCREGVLTCEGADNGSAEVCDGRDNDCDGTVDNGLGGSLGPCGSDVGSCIAGHFECLAGVKTCMNATGPQPEVCDGDDNDCNGTADDNLSLGVCGSDVGECQLGNELCVGGLTVCQGEVTGTPETCDGKDNNCDGSTDNGIAGYPGTCGTDTGECVAGTLTCVGGAPTCTGRTSESFEMCDGLDNDCDGTADDTCSRLSPAATTCPGTPYELGSCLFAASSREQRIDDLGQSTLGARNSVQLHGAAKGSLVYAVWLDRRNDRGDIFANWSTNGGVTWQGSDDGAATEDTGDKVDPKVAFGRTRDANNVMAYLAYGRYDGDIRGVYVRRDTNSGRSWAGARSLASSSFDNIFVRLAVAPDPTGTDDYVAVCWEAIHTDGATRPNIFCDINNNDGRGADWLSGRIRVNGTADNAILPNVAMDRSYVYVTWQEGTNIKVARAAMSGHPNMTFGQETTLNTTGPGQKPRIATDGSGRVIVVWEDVSGALIAIRSNSSTNSGASWLASDARVDNDVVDGDSVSPMVVMRPGTAGSPARAFVAWSDTNRGQADIYVTYSDDTGSSWAIARRATDGLAGAAASFAPHLAVSPTDRNVYVVWEDLRGGTERDIYLGFSRNDGETWNVPDYRIDESPAGQCDASSPLVLPSSGRAAVIWIDNRLLSGGSLETGANADIYTSYVQ